MTDTIKTIKVISFSGKDEDWNRWSKTFLATATAKGYREVLKPTDAAKQADEDKNTLAYSDLMLSCQDDVTFGMVDESISTDFPDGDARLAWKNLYAKFEPTTGAEKVRLKTEFQLMRMEEATDDPDPWITKLEITRRRLITLGHKMDDDDILIHILNNLPTEYETVIEISEEDLTLGKLTLQVLKQRTRARYARLSKKSDVEASNNSVALMMKTGFKGACNVCGKIGHKGTDCFSLDKNKSKKEEWFKNIKDKKVKKGYKKKNNNKNSTEHDTALASTNAEMVLMTTGKTNRFPKNIWIADSGATAHMTNSMKGMFDMKDTNKTITVGDGRQMVIQKTGKWRGTALDSEGQPIQILLTNVDYVEGLMVNLFSLTDAMEKGFQVLGSKTQISIEKGERKLSFATKIGSPTGYVYGAIINPTHAVGISAIAQKLEYKEAHDKLGHPGSDKLKKTAERLAWELNHEDSPCEDCLTGKAKRNNMNKAATNKSTKAGERLMIDISSVKNNRKNGKKYWLMVIDEASSMKWSYFLQNKADQTNCVISLIKELNSNEKTVKKIRCDNAGENQSLQKQCQAEGLGITFEFTARETPQQNGKVERAFATLYGRMRAMMIGAGFEEERRHELWTEAASTATKLDNILSNDGKTTPYNLFYGKNPEYEKYLRTFGEIGIVAVKPGHTIKNKLGNRGITCMFLGYAKDHAGNVYRMLNLQTRKVMLSRDIIWTNKMYADKVGKTRAQFWQENNSDDEDEDLQQEAMENEDATNMTPPVREPKLPPQLRKLQPYNNPGTLEVEDEVAGLCFFVPEKVAEDNGPTTYQDAWHHPDKEKRNKWREAIRLEFSQMIKNRVWSRKGCHALPSGRKGIGTKWVFKEKKNGIYRARLVAKGYNQVAGVDFQYNFAPVTSEVTLRVLLVLWVKNNYFAEVADVQTAFLNGDLEEEIYLMKPEGLTKFMDEENEEFEGNYLKMERSIYGLVQAARQFWIKFTMVLKKDMNFLQHSNDSCLFKREDEDGTVIIILYVDDCFTVGSKAAVKKALGEIEKHFSITRSEQVEDFIGCTITRKGNQVTLHQPDLIKKLLMKFEKEIKDLKPYDTPAAAGTRIVRNQEDGTLLSDEEQSKYRSGVGSLLYLLKHSRPEMSNSIRELSKAMDGANKAHQKALYRAIKYLEQTKDRQLILEPKEGSKNWEIRGYCDSDFAGDSDSRKSVSGFVIFFCGVPISWKSKGQKSVALSSTEAEYMAVSEVAMEILYIAGILQFLGIKPSYPIEVQVDNIGAIYLSKTATTGSRTKHIDTRYHFVRDYIEDGILKVVFVRSAENIADIFTKNLNGEQFRKHEESLNVKGSIDGKTVLKMPNRKGVKIGDTLVTRDNI